MQEPASKVLQEQKAILCLITPTDLGDGDVVRGCLSALRLREARDRPPPLVKRR